MLPIVIAGSVDCRVCRQWCSFSFLEPIEGPPPTIFSLFGKVRPSKGGGVALISTSNVNTVGLCYLIVLAPICKIYTPCFYFAFFIVKLSGYFL